MEDRQKAYGRLIHAIYIQWDRLNYVKIILYYTPQVTIQNNGICKDQITFSTIDSDSNFESKDPVLKKECLFLY